MAERFKPHAAVGILLIKGGSILLLRRANTGWSDGLYNVPAGHIDAGESASMTAIREAKEEIGVIIEPGDIKHAHTIHRKGSENGLIYLNIFFVTDKWIGEPINNEPDACDELVWFKLDKLPENIIPFIRDVLGAYRQGVYYSEAGWQN